MNQHAYSARRNATFFQFPLCALAFGRTAKERFDAFMHFAVFETGQKHWRKLNNEQRATLIESKIKSQSLPADFDQTQDSHCVAICGADVMKIKLGSVTHCLTQHAELKTFVSDFEQRHGRDAFVRLRSDLVFEALAGNGVTPVELSLLSAIYSIIGRKQGPVRISREQIICRALGYKSKAVMAKDLPTRSDGLKPGIKPFTEWIIRSRIQNLKTRRFFVCSTYGHRQTYYSHRMTQNQLRRAIIEMKTFKFATERLQQLNDEAMTDAIRNQRAVLKDQPPPVPTARPFQTDGSFPIEDIRV